MEALAAFGVNWKLLLIQGVNFGILMLLLYRFLYKPILALLDKRQQMIEKGINDAREATQEKELITKEKASIIAEARADGGKIVDELRKLAMEKEREIIRDAQEKSTLLLKEAEKKSNAEREYFLRESEKEIARLAILAAEKIIVT